MPFCASLQGKRIALGQNYFNLGDVLELPKPEKVLIKNIEVDTEHGRWINEVYKKYQKADTLRYTFNYEPISHPPLHSHCRCCLIPIVFGD